MTAQRNTKQRQLVLDAVCSRTDHPTADQVYLDVRKKNPRVSRGTVYRNLAVLEGNGEILQVKTPTASRYDLTVRPHYHVMCTVCGNVCDAPFAYQSQIDQRMQELTGFAITGHATLFEGVCPACQAEYRQTANLRAESLREGSPRVESFREGGPRRESLREDGLRKEDGLQKGGCGEFGDEPGTRPSPSASASSARESERTGSVGAGDAPLTAGEGGLQGRRESSERSASATPTGAGSA